MDHFRVRALEMAKKLTKSFHVTGPTPACSGERNKSEKVSLKKYIYVDIDFLPLENCDFFEMVTS